MRAADAAPDAPPRGHALHVKDNQQHYVNSFVGAEQQRDVTLRSAKGPGEEQRTAVVE
jgi:hypothetical protein